MANMEVIKKYSVSKSAQDFSLSLSKVAVNEFKCRICFEIAKKNLELITPCSCSGSIKYVHENCLKTWIASQTSTIAESKCEVCKSNYIVEVSFIKRCSLRNLLKIGKIIWVYIAILLSAMAALFILLFMLASNKISLSNEKNTMRYSIAIIIVSAVMEICLFSIIVRVIAKICYEQKKIQWRIMSRNLEVITEFVKDGNETMTQVNHKVLPDFSTSEMILSSGIKTFKVISRSTDDGISNLAHPSDPTTNKIHSELSTCIQAKATTETKE